VLRATTWPNSGYNLRNTCLSTWLNDGVYAIHVAEWAGHGVDVLLHIYAKCSVGRDNLAKRRISEALCQDLSRSSTWRRWTGLSQ
jgi:hypothetical protein